MAEIIIRDAVPEDAEALLAIYAPYIRDTAITFEYDVPSVEDFQHRIINISEKYPYLVAEEGGKIIGYAYAAPFHVRAACAWAVESSVYIDREKRKAGLGRRLYDALEAALKNMGIISLEACIAWPHEGQEDPYLTKDSVGFHTHLGFREVGHFKDIGSKFGRWYDLIWMEKLLGEHVPNPPAIKTYNSAQRCSPLL